MSIYTPPTLEAIRDRIFAELRTRLVDPLQALRGSLAYALGYALAGLELGVHQGLAWLADQALPQTAGDFQLRRWAEVVGVTPIAAARATSTTVTFTGTAGTAIPAGTAVARPDGAQYTLDAGVTIGGGGSITGAMTATEAGTAGNTDNGQSLALVGAISGVDAAATATVGFSGGLDDEATEALRVRVLAALAAPTAGGRVSDYQQWTRAALSGVSSVWVDHPVVTSNSVYVFFLLAQDGADSIPSGGDMATVQAYLDDHAPVTSRPFALAPTGVEVSLDIELLDDTTELRAQVTAALHAFFRTSAATGRTSAGAQTLYNAQIHAAIGAVTDRYILSDVDGGGADADVSLTFGQAAILDSGGVTWL